MTPLVVGVLVAVAVLVGPGRHGPVFARPRRSGRAAAVLRRLGHRVGRSRLDGSELAVTAEIAELLALCLSAGLGPDAALDLAAGSSDAADPRRDRVIALLRGEGPSGSVAGEALAGAPRPKSRDVSSAASRELRRARASRGSRASQEFRGSWRSRAPGPFATVSTPAPPAAPLTTSSSTASLTASSPTGSRGGSQGAVLLGVAWWMSRERGSPLAAVVSTCARTLRAEDAAERRQRAAEAGPRASMWLLTALPVIGPGLAALAGVDVVAAYSAPVAIVSCTVGVVLTGAGWCWARRLLRTAARPVRHG